MGEEKNKVGLVKTLAIAAIVMSMIALAVGVYATTGEGSRGPTGLQGPPGEGDGHSLDAADGSPTDAVYVNNHGNVGIGTMNPSEQLDVVGNVAVSGDYTYASEKTYYLNIPGCAFQKDKTSDTDEFAIYPGGHVYVESGAGNNLNLYAPAYLPEGATVTNFTVYYYDVDGSNDLQISYSRLVRTSKVGIAYQKLAEISSIATSGSPVVDYSYNNTINSMYETIDNENYNYHIQIWEYEQDVSGSTLRFIGCDIEYTMDTIAP